jgi:hypothetical protein
MNSSRHLHIVSFNIPYPPNYGGLIDVFYKIRTLSELGIQVHLHTFFYDGRKRSAQLEDLCYETHYYPRLHWGNPFTSKMPYIVETRKSNKLLHNLSKDNYPILFEGIHCTYYLNHPALADRLRVVRMHNIENLYYKNLARVERNFFKRYYLNQESQSLKYYQQILSKADLIAAISPVDQIVLNLKYHNSFYLPVFHSNSELSCKAGKGKHILYHGNLGVGENNEAALFLVNNICNDIDLPFIIAGSNPSKELLKSAELNPNIKIVANPDVDEINHLINDSQINLMPTFQDTGIKLKLINSLYKGRFCIVNTKMVKDTGLESICIVTDDLRLMKQKIKEYFVKDFDETEISKRSKILHSHFNNRTSAEILIRKLFPENNQ